MAKSQLTGGNTKATDLNETAPAETAPAETAPAETAPAETAPAETAPAETAPAETAPAETAQSAGLTAEEVQGMIDASIAKAIPSPEDLQAALGEHFPSKDEQIELIKGEVASEVSAQLDARAMSAPAPAPAPSGDAMADSAAADTAARDAAEQQAAAAAKTEAARVRAAAKAAEDAQRSAQADYEVALAGEGDLVDLNGAMRLRFGDGSGFIASLPSVDATLGGGMFYQRADQLIQETAIDFDPGQPAALLTEVWLISDTGSRRQEISGGLRIGAGSCARLPAGHLAFPIG